LLLQLLSGRIDPVQIVALLTALVLGITVHEFSHAAAATWLGDTLPARQGRLTLAPLAHLDVMGSLMFLVGGFGWGKPVQFNPYALRMNPRTGSALVALAGPVSNVILAAVVAIPLRLLPLVLGTRGGFFLSNGPEAILFELLLGIVQYNLLLAVFNLIPIFPLDGFSILLGILPADLAYRFEITKQWGFLLLFALLFFQSYLPFVGTILYEPVTVLTRLFTGL
jgi:Zn-dependent protease